MYKWYQTIFINILLALFHDYKLSYMTSIGESSIFPSLCNVKYFVSINIKLPQRGIFHIQEQNRS